MILNLLLIAVIAVIVVDLTDFVDFIKSAVSYILTGGKSKNSNYRLKPFDCSLCTTFWLSIIYLLVIGKLSIPTLAISLVIAYLTPVIKMVFELFTALLETLITRIMNKLD